MSVLFIALELFPNAFSLSDSFNVESRLKNDRLLIRRTKVVPPESGCLPPVIPRSKNFLRTPPPLTELDELEGPEDGILPVGAAEFDELALFRLRLELDDELSLASEDAREEVEEKIEPSGTFGLLTGELLPARSDFRPPE